MEVLKEVSRFPIEIYILDTHRLLAVDILSIRRCCISMQLLRTHSILCCQRL